MQATQPLPGRSYAVCLVHLVCFVYLVSFVQPIKRDRPDRPTVLFYRLLQYENECADIHVATGIDLLTKFYL